jgi:hypothetical protein
VSAYTPGPWEVWNDTVHAGPSKVNEPGMLKGGRGQICTVEQREDDDNDDDDFDLGDEAEANARLIAAAPELADALRAFVRQYDRAVGAGAQSQTVRPDDPLIVAARAVLEKAGVEP